MLLLSAGEFSEGTTMVLSGVALAAFVSGVYGGSNLHAGNDERTGMPWHTSAPVYAKALGVKFG